MDRMGQIKKPTQGSLNFRTWFNSARTKTGVAIMIVAVFALSWGRLLRHEPNYKGKRLSTWLLESRSFEARNDAIDAVREAGTNGLPVMLELLQARDSALFVKLRRLAERQRFFRFRIAADWERRSAGLRGFQILGPTGQPAIPALTMLMVNSNTTYEAAAALRYIGCPALEALGEVLTHGPPLARSVAALILGELNEAPSVRYSEHPAESECDQRTIVRLLINGAKDDDCEVRRSAKAALVRASLANPDGVVSELLQSVNAPDANVREAAILALTAATEARAARASR